jgi:hypothetical protein
MRRLGGPSRGEHSRELVPIRKDIAMLVTRTRMVVPFGVSLYVAVMVFADGVAAERIRFDGERGVVLHRYDEAVQQWWHEFLMTAERRLEEASPVAADAIPADAIPAVWS